MNPRTGAFLQLLSLAMLAWFGCRALAQWHVSVVVLVLLLALSNVLAAWIVRYQPTLFAALVAKPVIRSYFVFVCWCLGERIPDPNAPQSQLQNQLLLHTENDFRVAAQRAKQIVRGQDDAIDRVLGRIQETVTLRSRRKSGSMQPLGSFLLLGHSGIGKRYLARVLSKLLFPNAGTLVFECDQLAVDTLIGTATQAGELLDAVRQHPHQLIVFERVELASPEVIRVLTTILTRGEYQAPDTKEPVSFASAVIVLTSSSGVDSLLSLSSQSLPEGMWHTQSAETLAAETSLGSELLNALSDIVLCHPLSDDVKAQVVAILMKKETAAHGVSLSRVDPEIIASQVLQITEENGFALVPERVKKLLRKPLLAAHEHDQITLSLRVRLPESVPAGVLS